MISAVRGLDLQRLVQHFPELQVVLPLERRRVLLPAGHIDPARLGPFRRRIERIDLDRLQSLLRRFHIATDRQRARANDLAIAARPMHVVTLCRQIAFVVRRHEQVFATLAGIGARQPHVRNPSLVDVHRADDQGTRLELHDERPDAEIEHQRAVRRIRVRGEDELLRRAIENAEHLVRHDADLFIALDDRRARHRGIEKPVRLQRAVEIGVIVGLLSRVTDRKSALELVVALVNDVDRRRSMFRHSPLLTVRSPSSPSEYIARRWCASIGRWGYA